MRPFNANLAWIAAAAVSLIAADAAAQTAGIVQGRVLDDTGAPLPGVEVVARFQSNPGGVSISSKPAVSGPDGRYSIDIRQPVGTWSIHASTTIGGIPVKLTPDNPALFAGNAGAIRNLQTRYFEQTSDSSYGIGGIVVISRAIGDYDDIAGTQVTLTPAGGGPAITRTVRQTGEGWVVTGVKPVTQVVTAQLNGKTLQLTKDNTKNWATSYTGGFVTGGYNDTRHMRLMIK